MRFWIAAVLAALALPARGTAGTVFLLDGRGWGHGVGMSQWGAEGYARHGYDYRRILAHYYAHTHIGIADPRDVRVLLAEGQDSVRVVVARGASALVPGRRPGATSLAPGLVGFRLGRAHFERAG